MSRNKKYEKRLREEGLDKITVWIPKEASVDFKLMAAFCVENKNHVPFMVRDLITGRMRKAI